jgi:carbon monoxide dehydrogenase subunit G
MKKIILKKSWVIRAPREAVYAIVSDFENVPTYFPKVAQSLRILKKDGDTLTIEAKAKTFGRIFTVQMRTRLRPPIGYVSDNRSEIGTSGHEEFLMEEIPEGTRIDYQYEVELQNPILRLLGGFLIGRYAMRYWERAVIDELKEMVEK